MGQRTDYTNSHFSEAVAEPIDGAALVASTHVEGVGADGEIFGLIQEV